MNFNATTEVAGIRHIVHGLLAAALFLSQPLMAADAPTVFRAVPNASKVRIDGDSTTHEWYMAGTMAGGTFEVPAGVQIDSKKEAIPGLADGKLTAKVSAIIPVRSMHSEVKVGSSIMDGLYQDALKEKTSPRITYTLSEMKLKSGHAAGKPFEFDTAGELQIAGVTNKVSMPVTVESLDGGKIKIAGVAPLKMTDFKIEPPAPNIGMGLMKCKDDVKVSFEWTLAPEAAAAAK
jgi:hypothetical protein